MQFYGTVERDPWTNRLDFDWPWPKVKVIKVKGQNCFLRVTVRNRVVKNRNNKKMKMYTLFNSLNNSEYCYGRSKLIVSKLGRGQMSVHLGRAISIDAGSEPNIPHVTQYFYFLLRRLFKSNNFCSISFIIWCVRSTECRSIFVFWVILVSAELTKIFIVNFMPDDKMSLFWSTEILQNV